MAKRRLTLHHLYPVCRTSGDLVIHNGGNKPHERRRRSVINNTWNAAQAATTFSASSIGVVPHKRRSRHPQWGKQAAQAAQTFFFHEQHLECRTSGDTVLGNLNRRSAAQAAIASSAMGNQAAQAAQTFLS
jgi:hypothetical protein